MAEDSAAERSPGSRVTGVGLALGTVLRGQRLATKAGLLSCDGLQPLSLSEKRSEDRRKAP